MTNLMVEVTFGTEMLATQSNNPELHSDYIASKAPDAKRREEEIAAVGVVEYEEKGMSVFARDERGREMIWDYQVKGFFKEACKALKDADGALSGKLAAYRKKIDLLVEVYPRSILLHRPPRTMIGELQRPLRAQTAQGEREAIAHSETVPEGTRARFVVSTMKADLADYVLEWLAYGVRHGMGQWRSASHGRFRCVVKDEEGRVLLDTTGDDPEKEADELLDKAFA